MLSQPSTHQKQSRKPTDFLLDLPQDYVEELLQERGPRGRGLSRDSITHPYHVLLSRCKDTNIFCTPSSLLNNSASTLGFPVKPGMTEGKAGTRAKREPRPEEMNVWQTVCQTVCQRDSGRKYVSLWQKRERPPATGRKPRRAAYERHCYSHHHRHHLPGQHTGIHRSIEYQSVDVQCV